MVEAFYEGASNTSFAVQVSGICSTFATESLYISFPGNCQDSRLSTWEDMDVLICHRAGRIKRLRVDVSLGSHSGTCLAMAVAGGPA